MKQISQKVNINSNLLPNTRPVASSEIDSLPEDT